MQYFYQFLIAEHRVGPKGRLVDIGQVEPGDVIQLSFLQGQFSHSLFVVDTGQNPSPGNVLVATHSSDSDYRQLDSYYFQAYRCLKISV